MKLRIGTRGSRLALAQAREVADALTASGVETELVAITTAGDRGADPASDPAGVKGLFVTEIVRALLDGEVELAVHSAKDLPAGDTDGLVIAAVPERASALDVLVTRDGDLPPGARVGTSSIRRQAQVFRWRPDVLVKDLRGNVDTRIRKLREGVCDAVLLAVAGLERLGRRGEVTEVLEPDVFLPAPGQGAIALEGREDDGPIAAAVAPLDHAQTARAVAAERALLAGLQGGCNVPLGAYAVEDDGALRLTAFVARPDGSNLMRGQTRDTDPARAGAALAEQLLARGARELMRG